MANEEASRSAVEQKPRFFYGYIVVIAGFLIMLMGFGTVYSFGVFFKPVMNEFGWTREMTSGIYAVNLFVWGLLCIWAGRLNDRLGPRLVIMVCGLALGLGYLLTSQINALWQIYLLYGVLVPAGMSGATVPAVSCVTRWFVKRRGLMNGLVVCGGGVGTVIVPPIATRLIEIIGWRNSYLTVGIITMVIIIIAAQFMKRDPSQMGMLPYGEGRVKTSNAIPEIMGYNLSKSSRMRGFWILGIIFFAFLFCQQIVMVHIVPHATDLGISAESASFILMLVGGLSVAGRVGYGNISDKIGSKRTLVSIMTILAAVFVFLIFARELWALYLFAVVFGFGYGGFVAMESVLVADLFGLKAHGAIYGVLIFIGMVGGSIGTIVAGRLFDMTGGYGTSFIITAIIIFAGLILNLLLPRKTIY